MIVRSLDVGLVEGDISNPSAYDTFSRQCAYRMVVSRRPPEHHFMLSFASMHAVHSRQLHALQVLQTWPCQQSSTSSWCLGSYLPVSLLFLDKARFRFGEFVDEASTSVKRLSCGSVLESTSMCRLTSKRTFSLRPSTNSRGWLKSYSTRIQAWTVNLSSTTNEQVFER